MLIRILVFYYLLCKKDNEENNVIESSEDAFNILLNNLENICINSKSSLDIPIVFTPSEMKRYNINLVIASRREAGMNWIEKDPQ